MLQQRKREDEEMLTVKEIWMELGKKISLRKIYKLIEDGDLAPAFRLAGSRGTCVSKKVVVAYKSRCIVDLGQ